MTHTVLIVIVGRMATTITTGLVRSKVNTAMSRNSLSAYVYKNNGYMVPCGDIMEQGVLPVASGSSKYFYFYEVKVCTVASYHMSCTHIYIGCNHNDNNNYLPLSLD